MQRKGMGSEDDAQVYHVNRRQFLHKDDVLLEKEKSLAVFTAMHLCIWKGWNSPCILPR